MLFTPTTLNSYVANALVKLATYFNSATPFSMTANISWEDQGVSSLGSSSSSSTSYQNESGKLYINPLDRFVFGDKPGVLLVRKRRGSKTKTL